MASLDSKRRPTDHDQCVEPSSSPRRRSAASSLAENKARSEPTLQEKLVLGLRVCSTILFFLMSTVCLHIQQWLGAPLYFINRSWFYRWQSVVKESAGILVLTINHWLAPAEVQISSDSDVAGQIQKTPNGDVVFDFPDRLVLIANHNIYTDWISIWWSAYCARHHGHLIVVLKDSIRKIPILGPGLMFFSWIFLSRRWEADMPRLRHRISRLSTPNSHTPMWLLIFPEGTNLSRRSRALSKRWAEKTGKPDFEHVLLPRTRGLQFCLEGLAESVEWVYDCTIAYEGIPTGEYGQELYSLRALYLEGQKAPFTHVYWRRFAVKDIPLNDPQAFDEWLLERWAEKDKLLGHFQQHGCFPASNGYIRAKISLRKLSHILQVLASTIAVLVMWYVVKYLWQGVRSLSRSG